MEQLSTRAVAVEVAAEHNHMCLDTETGSGLPPHGGCGIGPSSSLRRLLAKDADIEIVVTG